MKKIKEVLLRKDSTIRKVQYDKEWFFSVSDMERYLGESLAETEYINLPVIVDTVTIKLKCATLEDIERARAKEPLNYLTASSLNHNKSK